MTLQGNAEFSARKFGNDFDRIVEQWRQPLLTFLFRLLDDQRLAEEVAVESFLRFQNDALRGVADGQIAVELYRDAIDIAGKQHRAKPRNVECSPKQNAECPADIQAVVRRCIGNLSEMDRLVVLLHKYQKLSYAQIGSVLSLGEAQVKTLLFGAYKTLQHGLTAQNTG